MHDHDGRVQRDVHLLVFYKSAKEILGSCRRRSAMPAAPPIETVQNPPRGRRGRPRGRLEAVLEAVPRGRRKTQAILHFLKFKGVLKIENHQIRHFNENLVFYNVP